MKVQDVMTRSVTTCSPQDTLHAAAQKLWERDCGCLPVVDAAGRPLAMLTDRDVCMAGFTTGKPLHELRVAQAMSKELVSCRAAEELPAAAARMAKHGVRRLPVLDATGGLVGVLSLNDFAVAAAREPALRASGATSEALRVLLAVCAHRASATPAAAAPPAATAPAAPTPTSPVVATPAPAPARATPPGPAAAASG